MLSKLFRPRDIFGKKITSEGSLDSGALPQLTRPEDKHPQAWNPDLVTKQ